MWQIDANDMPNRLKTIWNIYERELFGDIGFCGNKPLYALLELHASFLLALNGRYFVKKSEYEEARHAYGVMKTNLIQDLKTLIAQDTVPAQSERQTPGPTRAHDQTQTLKMDEHYRYNASESLVRIYASHLHIFASENRNFLTDVFYDFVRKTTKDSSRIPTGLLAVLPDTTFSKPASFPNPDLTAFVFSVNNSSCKIVAFVEGCCDAAIYNMYVFVPKKGHELQKIDIKSYNDDGFGKYIHVGHSELTWDKKNNLFTVDCGNPYERKYVLDIERMTVCSVAKSH
ncbi:MAG: hypothetical protein LBD36_02340 [Holosporales bacterium]|nr:hypothetical protein [Holosporales bacterium]